MNLFDPDLQLINTKSIIKNKFKEFLSGLKKFKVQTILFLGNKKKNDLKEAFKSMHQSIMTKIKNSASEDLIVIKTIVKHSIMIFK